MFIRQFVKLTHLAIPSSHPASISPSTWFSPRSRVLSDRRRGRRREEEEGRERRTLRCRERSERDGVELNRDLEIKR